MEALDSILRSDLKLQKQLLTQKTAKKKDTIIMSAARGNHSNVCALCIKHYIEACARDDIESNDNKSVKIDVEKMGSVNEKSGHSYDKEKDELGIIGAINIAAATSCYEKENHHVEDTKLQFSPSKKKHNSHSNLVAILLDYLLNSSPTHVLEQSQVSSFSTTIKDAAAKTSSTTEVNGIAQYHDKIPNQRDDEIASIRSLVTPAATLAARSGAISVLRVILDRFPIIINANTNRRHDTLIMHAVKAKQILSTAWLLSEQGCNILCRDIDGVLLYYSVDQR